MAFSSIDRNLRWLAVVLLVVPTLASSPRSTGAASSRMVQVPAKKPEPPSSGPQATAAKILEFDLPADWTREADDPKRITGFRIRYLEGRRQDLLRVVDISREQVVVKGDTGRITLDLTGAAKPADVVVRMQSLTRGQAGPWSESVAVVPTTAGGPARAAKGAGARAARLVTVGEIEGSPKLRAVWEKCVPAAKRDEGTCGLSPCRRLGSGSCSVPRLRN